MRLSKCGQVCSVVRRSGKMRVISVVGLSTGGLRLAQLPAKGAVSDASRSRCGDGPCSEILEKCTSKIRQAAAH
jgi:hypothetical protein